MANKIWKGAAVEISFKKPGGGTSSRGSLGMGVGGVGA